MELLLEKCLLDPYSIDSQELLFRYESRSGAEAMTFWVHLADSSLVGRDSSSATVNSDVKAGKNESLFCTVCQVDYSRSRNLATNSHDYSWY